MFGAMPAAAVPATNFDGLVALSNCSGAVIRWSSSVGSDKALVLTNGHCFELMGATQVVVGQPAVRDVYLLSPAGGSAGTVQTTKLLYATMNQTDVALYQLGLTFKQLRVQYGVHPITLASARPGKYAAISIISGYWLTEYDCHLHGFAYRLHEDVWTWRNSLRYEDGGCPVIGGTSGSPVLNASRLEIGINNTRNEDGEMCTLNNPCEENRQGAETVHPGRGYGEETWIFYTCLSSRKIDLSKIGCRLAKP
jgi:V8-like Glu-specific endopeptidase